MIKLLFKSALCFSLIFILNQNALQASCKPVESCEEQPHCTLTQIHQENIDLRKLTAGVEDLMRQGYPAKRAREIYVQEQIAKVFEKKYKSPLLPAVSILGTIGGICEVEFHKTDDGVMDDIFTISDMEKLKGGKAPIVYNETHFVEDDTPIQPLDLRTLKDRYTYTLQYPSMCDMLMAQMKAEISRPCGKVNATLPMAWSAPVLEFQTALNERVSQARIGHTLTILQPDGRLTVFNVAKAVVEAE